MSIEQLIEAAKDLYEGTPGMTMARLAELTGISKNTLSNRRRDDGWRKDLITKTGTVTEAAVAAATLFAKRGADPAHIAPVATTSPETDAAVSVLLDPLPAERDRLLKRHREEWAAPRGMASEAVRLRETDPFKAMERAKLAKITAETLKLVQEGERKAHGLDLGVDVPPGHVVVIERE